MRSIDIKKLTPFGEELIIKDFNDHPIVSGDVVVVGWSRNILKNALVLGETPAGRFRIALIYGLNGSNFRNLKGVEVGRFQAFQDSKTIAFKHGGSRALHDLFLRNILRP